jgi:hypothetical protein
MALAAATSVDEVRHSMTPYDTILTDEHKSDPEELTWSLTPVSSIVASVMFPKPSTRARMIDPPAEPT